MKCKYCVSEMRLDDKNTLGAISINHWVCDDCGASAIEEIRYGEYDKLTFEAPEKGI